MMTARRAIFVTYFIAAYFTGCGDELRGVEESVVFVSLVTNDGRIVNGSGVLVEPGYAVTACHVIEDTHLETAEVTYPGGGEVDVGEFACLPGRDIAVAHIEEDTSGMELAPIGSMSLVRHGCTIGMKKLGDDDIVARCGLMRKKASGRIVLLGMNAPHGMSGGPCTVDGAVVGIVSYSIQAPGKEYELARGLTYCAPIRRSDVR